MVQRRQKRVAILAKPEFRTAQAEQMLVDRISGATIATLAKKYEVSEATVFRRFTLAEQTGLIRRLRAELFERLVPKVLATYEAALDCGDLDAARDVAFGLGLLRKNPPCPEDAAEDGIATLEEYKRLRLRRADPGSEVH